MERDQALVAEDDDFVPLPDDGEHITRGEFRRMTGLLIKRMGRLEKLCFEDETDNAGNVVRPSLENLIKRVDTHLKVLCDYARAARWVLLVVSTVGGGLVGLHELGVPLSWLLPWLR